MRVAKVLKQGLAGLLLGFFLAGPAMCLTPAAVERYIKAGTALDLSDDNLGFYDSAAFEEARQDKRFMALLRAKLRVARCIDVMKGDTKVYDSNFLVDQPSVAVAMLCQGGQLSSPMGLAGRAVEKIIRPLELEQVLLDLPRYYEAIVNTPDWEKKFSIILSRKYVSLNEGESFHLAGFPEMEDKDYYTKNVGVELADGSLDLDEADSSIEAWLYSFWMRRWKEGNMNAARLALDWIEKASKQ